MNQFNIDLEEDFADQMLRAIEKEYGRSIVRIPYFERLENNAFDIKIIFSDFRLLEAQITVVPFFDMPSIQIQGTYY